jgi:hypothetical protein
MIQINESYGRRFLNLRRVVHYGEWIDYLYHGITLHSRFWSLRSEQDKAQKAFWSTLW